MRSKLQYLMRLMLALSLAGCAATSSTGSSDSDPFGNFSTGKGDDGDGTRDAAASVQIIDDIDLNSYITGDFDPRVKTMGFTFRAKAGAAITIDLEALAGKGAFDLDEGEMLNLYAKAYGPMQAPDEDFDGEPDRDPNPGNREERGAELFFIDGLDSADLTIDGDKQVMPTLEIAEDGEYLFLFVSFDDPGEGSYRVGVGCEGTHTQCGVPVEDVPCTPTTRYIQGGQTIKADETWSECKVVLLETTIIDEDALLTINPGVTVQGNYLGTEPFGEVQMVVNGQMQAVGTAENPVVFDALTDNGWKGLVLGGQSNTLQHVVVQNAHTGISLMGGNNTVLDTVIDSSDTGMYVGPDSLENRAERLQISQVRNGMHLEGVRDGEVRTGGQIAIVNTTITGRGKDVATSVGIWGSTGGPAHFLRALVSGFEAGMSLNDTELTIEDGTLANNKYGAYITGPDAGVHPAYTCPAFPAAQPVVYHPPTFTYYRRDPAFINCDVVGNEGYGILVDAPQIVVVENSNVRGNGEGIVIKADALGEGSRINHNNIIQNCAGDGSGGCLPHQLETFHTNGVLDLENNFWGQISDPSLAATRLTQHTQAITCRGQQPNNSCTYNSGTKVYACGAFSCTRNASNTWDCSATVNPSWTSEVSFTQFSPIPFTNVGPRDLEPPVTDVRQEQGL